MDLEAAEPVSPPAMRRAEVERRRLEASGRAALTIAVRYILVCGIGLLDGRVTRRDAIYVWVDGVVE